ncbi:MAG: hypothetical protein VX700_13750 [Pseudomonadota bacterium]|nr:hypothetical protein [Pseudomonadota bacterium]
MNAQKSRTPKKMSEKRLRNIAIWYCERYLVSVAKLTDYLNKRLYRDIRDADERAHFTDLISGIVSDLSVLGYVNDREAASARLRAALRSGYAKEAAMSLAARSAMVERKTVETELGNALTQVLPELKDVDTDSSEGVVEQAIIALKRARRGPFRLSGQDIKSRRRDAAWLQRRGFRMNAIRTSLDIDPLDE